MTETTPRSQRDPDLAETEVIDAEVIDFPTSARESGDEPTQTATDGSDTPATVPAPTQESDETEAPLQRVDSQVETYRAQGGDWLADLAERARTQRAVIPEWARSRQDATQTMRWVAMFYAHVGAYHATRSPKYLLKLTIRTPRGTGRLVGAFAKWVFDWEGEPTRLEAAKKNDPEIYLKLSRQRDRRVRARVVVAVLVAVTLVTAGLMVMAAPAWGQWAVLAALIGALGWLGAPADRPLIDRAVLPNKVEPLTSDVVLRALGALGMSEIAKALTAKNAEALKFTAPITRDGPGWRAEVDLPYGVTAADVMERRDKLASGLRRPLGCVWPEPVSEEHPGRLVLWVGDQDMAKAAQPTWPLLKQGAADLFKPLPFGHDQRGRLAELTLMFESVLIGAKPRMGKTFALRVLLLAVALDVLAEMRVFELKGTGDCEPLAQVAHDYASGADDDTLAQCMLNLRELHRELVTRAKTIKGLPRDICPENKVTPELAAKKSLGLHPLVLAIDECQELFTHPEFGEEAAKLAEAIIKRGPALGIILILATQRPDAKSLPTGVSANVGIRFCLRVMGQLENDMVLGTSMYKNGVRATTFTARDKGIGYLVGVTDDPQIVRSSYLDAPAAEQVAQRARARRHAAGRLTGYAAGQHEVAAAPSTSLLDDLLAAWPAGHDKAWSAELVERLAELRPQTYGQWADQDDATRARTLSAALKPLGVTPIQVGRRRDGKATTRYGLAHTTIAETVTNRDQKRAAT